MASSIPGSLGVGANKPEIDTGTMALIKSPLPSPTGTHAGLSAKDKQKKRLDENKAYLKNTNVKAFLSAIAAAEGGDYGLKFGGVKGKKNDKYQFTDFSTHPGAGFGGVSTPAGMYQITKPTWTQLKEKLGVADFTPDTQDLMAIEILRGIHAIEDIVNGNIDGALSKASGQWAALPKGPGLPNRYPKQPYMQYDNVVEVYKNNGGGLK